MVFKGIPLSAVLKFNPANELAALLVTARRVRRVRVGFRRGARRFTVRLRLLAIVLAPFVLAVTLRATVLLRAVFLTVRLFAGRLRASVFRVALFFEVRFFVVRFFVVRRFRLPFNSNISPLILLCPPSGL